MKQTRQDFFTANGEGIKIMTFTEFARHILRMECGESLELYAVVNRQTRECSRPLSVRKEQWNGTPFYLLGGHGQEVRTINFAGRPKEEFETTCHDVLDSYDAVESIGAVVSRLRELSPEELHKRIAEEMKTGCKYPTGKLHEYICRFVNSPVIIVLLKFRYNFVPDDSRSDGIRNDSFQSISDGNGYLSFFCPALGLDQK